MRFLAVYFIGRTRFRTEQDLSMSYSMSDLLQLVVSEGASDLHIRVGTPPTIRVHGILHRVEGPVLAAEGTEELMRSITSEEHIQHVRERGGADFGFAFGDMARFRVSVFKEQGNFGVDVPNFAEALRRALRQDPDVVLVGEMRDLETIDAAITAAETGHLVFGTLHTTGAAKTIDRVVNAFPSNQQEQIRIQLSTVMQAVISQLLIPRVDKPGRVAIFEIMVNTPSIAALIRDNKTFRINSDIPTGAQYGMVTLDSFLIDKYLAGMIAREEVVTKAQDSITIQAKLQELELAQAVGVDTDALVESKP